MSKYSKLLNKKKKNNDKEFNVKAAAVQVFWSAVNGLSVFAVQNVDADGVDEAMASTGRRVQLAAVVASIWSPSTRQAKSEKKNIEPILCGNCTVNNKDHLAAYVNVIQCDKIGLVLKILVAIFLTKVAQIFNHFGAI